MRMINIKSVEAAELEMLQQITELTFRQTFAKDNAQENIDEYVATSLSVEKLTEELQNANSEFYFAFKNNQIAGYLKVNRNEAQTELKDKNLLEIERVYVLNQHQREGIGKALCLKAIQLAAKYSSEFIWLGVWERNHSAIAFYKSMGFTEFDRHVFQLGTEAQTDIMMKRQVR